MKGMRKRDTIPISQLRYSEIEMHAVMVPRAWQKDEILSVINSDAKFASEKIVFLRLSGELFSTSNQNKSRDKRLFSEDDLNLRVNLAETSEKTKDDSEDDRETRMERAIKDTAIIFVSVKTWSESVDSRTIMNSPTIIA